MNILPRLGSLIIKEIDTPVQATFSLPIISSKLAMPVVGKEGVFSCLTSAMYSWGAGGGPAYIVAPFAHLLNTDE